MLILKQRYEYVLIVICCFFISDDAQLMTTESLKDISEKVPFKKHVEWSRNAKDLQNKSINDPQTINKENIHTYFKHLRLVNKNVSILWRI